MTRHREQRVFSNDRQRLEVLLRHLGPSLENSSCCVVWARGDAGPRDILIPPAVKVTRLAVVFEGRPLHLDRLAEWREWACGRVVSELRLECVPEPEGDSELARIATRAIEPWLRGRPAREEPGVRLGEWVRPESLRTMHNGASLLTLHFGEAMTSALSQLDRIRSRFRCVCPVSAESRDRFLEELQPVLSAARRQDGHGRGRRSAGVGGEGPRLPATFPELAVAGLRASLPRVFLYGESGVGKTLFAQYLSGLLGDVRLPVVRISIPEYLDREDMFEYDLFGYVRGTYTGGLEHGSPGHLLSNVGGVVFLDELGEASPTVQAKLLAYLDDYLVRPRGWTGAPFYCPTLLVAATNRTKLADGYSSPDPYCDTFRTDLLRRFTDRIRVPPLRERAESLPYILDCLLQDPGINGEAGVTEIGLSALRALMQMEFPGNFRQLEDLVRTACTRAMAEGRDFLSLHDVAGDSTAPSRSPASK